MPLLILLLPRNTDPLLSAQGRNGAPVANAGGRVGGAGGAGNIAIEEREEDQEGGDGSSTNSGRQEKKSGRCFTDFESTQVSSSGKSHAAEPWSQVYERGSGTRIV